MLTVIACLAVIGLLLTLTEFLSRSKLLKGEYHRKFFHITAGSFIAFWPWFMDWQTLRFLSFLMIIFVLLNWRFRVFNYYGQVRRRSYGVLFFAVAIFLCSLLAGQRVFFALAVLEVAVSDGLAAVIGTLQAKQWRYKVFGQRKTVIGSMVFWLVSVGILGGGLLIAHNLITLTEYDSLLVLMPALLTGVESLAVYGSDNLLLPLVTILILRLA